MKLHAQIHFLGIAGSGMAPLAILCHRQGFQVSGRDDGTSKILDKLLSLGISVIPPDKPDIVVYSSAILRDHPEFQKYLTLGIPLWHRSDLLAYFIDKAQTAVTISGTHGKTTTTGLLGYLLSRSTFSPTLLMGGFYTGLDPDGFSYDGKILVAESDESDGSFLKYRPRIAVVTNVAHDHPDFYKTQTAVLEAFSAHIKNIKQGGTLIYSRDCPVTEELSQGVPCKTLSYGFHPEAHMRCLDSQPQGRTTRLKLSYKDQIWEETLPLFGKHNIQNFLGALTAYLSITGDLNHSIEGWPAIDKRQSLLLDEDDLVLIDDYAHNPEKIQSFISSLKKAWPNQKISIVFEPHRYSRVIALYDLFCESFQGVSEVFLLPLYGANEIPDQAYDKNAFALGIESKSPGAKVTLVESPEDIYARIASVPPRVLGCVGAGSSSLVAHGIKKLYLKKKVTNLKT
jgi:UDP-N-acetylmuramate--alanine ligase